jgi:hypothetical protein
MEWWASRQWREGEQLLFALWMGNPLRASTSLAQTRFEIVAMPEKVYTSSFVTQTHHPAGRIHDGHPSATSTTTRPTLSRSV